MKKTYLALFSLTGLLALTPVLPSFAAEWETEIVTKSETEAKVEIPKTGWYEIDGCMYYNKNGKKLKGLQKIGSKYYYLDPSTGQRMTGLVNIKGKTYFFSTKTGARRKGFITYQGKTYYFGKKYYALKGHQKIKGKKYYFSKKGVMYQNKWLAKKYYYGDDGVRCYGWQTIKGKRYYFDPTTGIVQKAGWATIDKKTYLFASDGSVVLLQGLQKSSSNKKYYFYDENGEMLTGWQTSGKYTYYFSKKTGAALRGWHKISGKYYYFNTKYRLVKNKWIKNKYYVDENGARFYGLLTLGDKTYYLNPKTGLKTTGWTTIDKNTYYFDVNGVMAKDTWVDDRYLKSNGAMAKSTWVGAYYVNSKGYKSGKTRTTGLFTSSSKTYYLDENYEKVKGWVEIDGSYYYFDASSGVMAKSTWIEGYYVNENGVRVTNTLMTLSGKTYLFLADGSKAVGIQEYQGNSYYFSTVDGSMITGLKVVGENTYYFDPDANGAMVKNAERFIDNAYYKFDENGCMYSMQDMVSDESLGQAIAEYALQFVGNPYVAGGSSLTNGADCSGFTMAVFAHFGISLPHIAASQATLEGGMKIPTSELKPGDLVFYYNPIGHVAIYVGDVDGDGEGEVVHASNSAPYPQGGIKISDYDYTVITACVRFW